MQPTGNHICRIAAYQLLASSLLSSVLEGCLEIEQIIYRAAEELLKNQVHQQLGADEITLLFFMPEAWMETSSALS
jgi:hypothetical protein